MRSRITFVRVLNGNASGPWSLRVDRSFEKHTSDGGGPFKEVRQFLASIYAEATELSFDVLEVEPIGAYLLTGVSEMNIFLCPIVGAFFRPPAKTILKLLDAGHELVLDPEPENPYDSDAIKVGVRLNTIMIAESAVETVRDELMRYGATWEDLQKDEFGELLEDPVLHLGYVPRSGAKTAKIDGEPSFGNKEIGKVIGQPDWKATLTFSPAGQVLVQIVTPTQ